MDDPKKGDVILVANWGLRRDRANLCFIGSLTMGSTARAGVLGMIPPLEKNQKIKNHMEADNMRENILMPL